MHKKMQAYYRTSSGQDQSVGLFLHRIAEKLLEVKTLDLKTITAILGPRPFPLQESFREYLHVMDVSQTLT